LKFKLLLVIMGVMLIAVYGALAVLIVGLSGPRSAEIAPTTPETGAGEGPLTAREAYAMASSEAQNWREDAQLVNATASWANVASEEQLAEEVAWGFTFLSPQSAETQILSVTRAGAERSHEMRSTSTSRVADLTSWQVDSPDVVNLFLDHGGREFLNQHPGATITLRLGPEQESSRLVWLAMGIQSADKSTFVLQVDANTGEVISAAP
jgi:hypothetical protein